MPKTQISKRDELPSNFSIGKYSDTKNWGISEWVTNLEIRLLIGGAITFRNRADTDLDLGFDLARLTDHILREPILCEKQPLKQAGLIKEVSHTSVSDMTVFDFFCGSESAIPEQLKLPLELFKRTLNTNQTKNVFIMRPLWKLYEDVEIDDLGEVFVRVDLNSTEEKTIEDFRTWLKNIRALRDIKTPTKQFTKNDFESWSRYGLLPYLDLSNWAKARNTTISQQVIGATLFPDEFDISLAERVRKVTAPMARSVAQESFIDALRAQAAAELAEQSHKKTVPEH